MIDHRSLEWLQLLPPESSFVVEGAPPAVRAALRGRITHTGDTYVGWERTTSNLPDLGRFRAAVLFQPHGINRSQIEGAGFCHSRRLTAVPSLSDARWLLPLDTPRVAMAGLSLVTPWRYRDRVKRVGLVTLARLGQLRRVGDAFVLARREPSPVEARLMDLLQVPDVFLSLKTGPPRLMRKTTVQVMSMDGTTLAFAKLATSTDARAVVGREACVLRELARHAALRECVPDLLGTFEFPTTYASVLAPGPRKHGPSQFGQPHRAFLRSMARATEQRLPFRQSAMSRDIRTKLETLESRLPASWRARLTASLARIEAAFGSHALPLTLAHRDFGPWNTRLRGDGRLYVFDWDGAHWEMTPLYDLIGFHVLDYANFACPQDALGLAQRILVACQQWAPEVDRALVPYLLLAYLTETAVGRLLGALWRSDLMTDVLLRSIATLLDQQSGWIPDYHPYG